MSCTQILFVCHTVREENDMTDGPARVDSGISNDSQPRVNALSLASVVLAAVAVVGFAFGGVAVLAVFAVGAGHLALQQIKVHPQRGAVLAYLGLGVSYSMAAYALVSGAFYAIALSQQ